jgi:hypothetical protein
LQTQPYNACCTNILHHLLHVSREDHDAHAVAPFCNGSKLFNLGTNHQHPLYPWQFVLQLPAFFRQAAAGDTEAKTTPSPPSCRAGALILSQRTSVVCEGCRTAHCTLRDPRLQQESSAIYCTTLTHSHNSPDTAASQKVMITPMRGCNTKMGSHATVA